ncbi:hypothetical protein SLE2022_195180 [Rubroshorea leprosula]
MEALELVQLHRQGFQQQRYRRFPITYGEPRRDLEKAEDEFRLNHCNSDALPGKILVEVRLLTGSLRVNHEL